MLLNRIPVLDKGYVAVIDSSCDSQKIRDIEEEFFESKAFHHLDDFGILVLAIKCPLFVQLSLSKFDFKITTASKKTELEAFLPISSNISNDRSTGDIIANDIARTTDALLINPKAYQADGADKFMSQIITPINVYTTLIVQGSYNEWDRYVHRGGFPEPIAAYGDAISAILASEWK